MDGNKLKLYYLTNNGMQVLGQKMLRQAARGLSL